MAKAKITVAITDNEFPQHIKDQMWELYHRYYHYTREYFMERINRNNYFAFYKVDGRIVGFTGLRINRTEVSGKECLLIYVGQTIIDQAYRGNALIPRTVVKLCLRYWKDLLKGRMYFWADALTYKAYLVFAKTAAEYYPSYRSETPEYIRQLIRFVGEEYYEDAFCTETGTVQKNTVYVNDPSTHIDPATETDPDVLFYRAANPKYLDGHGLITITPLHLKTYYLTVAKCVKKALQGRLASLTPLWLAEKQMRLSLIPRYANQRLRKINRE